ncbi:DUF6299 family protein [Streptomyces sp. NPDC032472]|uniref:DUF6299 family protein n=1 Tax=Streptomyces sp. NPDC032472 TaxID=3155018 RepID=UPI0033DC7C74
MGTTGRRMALAALSALTAAAAFTAPAAAAPNNSAISVQPFAQIGEDGTITLSGTYRCDGGSPMGAKQISATVVQEGTHLTTSAGEAVCDGAQHEWQTTGRLPQSLGLPGEVHPGAARFEARLQEVRFSGLMPKSTSVSAEDVQEGEIVA